MYSCRARGFLKSLVISLPFSIEIVMSMKVICWEQGEKVQGMLLPFIIALNSCQLCLSVSGSALWSQMPMPSSMKHFKKKGGFQIFQKVALFIDGNIEVGNCWSQRHARYYA